MFLLLRFEMAVAAIVLKSIQELMKLVYVHAAVLVHMQHSSKFACPRIRGLVISCISTRCNLYWEPTSKQVHNAASGRLLCKLALSQSGTIHSNLLKSSMEVC